MKRYLFIISSISLLLLAPATHQGIYADGTKPTSSSTRIISDSTTLWKALNADQLVFPSYKGQDASRIVNTYNHYAGSADKNYRTNEFSKALFSLGANAKTYNDFADGYNNLQKAYQTLVGEPPPQPGTAELVNLLNKNKAEALATHNYVGTPRPGNYSSVDDERIIKEVTETVNSFVTANMGNLDNFQNFKVVSNNGSVVLTGKLTKALANPLEFKNFITGIPNNVKGVQKVDDQIVKVILSPDEIIEQEVTKNINDYISAHTQNNKITLENFKATSSNGSVVLTGSVAKNLPKVPPGQSFDSSKYGNELGGVHTDITNIAKNVNGVKKVDDQMGDAFKFD